MMDNPSDNITKVEWIVYIIQTTSGTLYTGITNDMERRFAAHECNKGAKFFHFAKPEKLIYQESHPNRSEASKRESAIKKMTRETKLFLCQRTNFEPHSG